MANRSSLDPALLRLFTAPERSLLSASRGADLERATEADLGRLLARARAVRDKWWDQFRSQRRSTLESKRGRGTEGNDRSRKKAELFADAVGRFEARIAALGAKVGAAVKGGRKARAQARPAKTARAAAHRGARAQTRKALAGFVTAKPGRRIVGPTAKAAADDTAPTTPAKRGKVTSGKVTSGTATRAATAAPSKKRHAGRVPSAVEAVVTKHKHKKKKATGIGPLAQLTVESKLKAARFKISGRDTQTRGHMAAQTRRAQGRRDARGR